MTTPAHASAVLPASAVVASATTGSDGAGLIAFLVVAALFVACWLLYKSMRRQLGRIDVSRGEARNAETDAAGQDGQPT